MSTPYRLGLVVPSSNVTMETELPQLLARRAEVRPERFTCHASRVRMTEVTAAQLAAMNDQGARAAAEVADAQVDAIAYGCLVAVMASGPGAHAVAERRLTEAVGGTPVVTSAGALVDGIRALGAERVALIAPYAAQLTSLVVDYLCAADIDVAAAVSLGVTDNRAVGRLDPARLVSIADRLDLRRVDALVVSACVQMPSLPVLEEVQRRTGVPTLSAATATARSLLDVLGLDPVIPGAGALLAPRRDGRRLASPVPLAV